MAARIALHFNSGQPGPRPLNPMRDLVEVANLMEVAFADELDASGRQLIREARAIGRAGPLALLLSLFSDATGGLTPGFVWEEDGRIVGNVTMAQSSKQKGAWYIANVAVLPHYRRRGIATGLMKTAIEHARRLKGQTVSLQVREISPAVDLYQQLNFQSQGLITRWQLDSRRQLQRIVTQGISPRPAERDDWKAIWQLFRSAPLAAQGWPDVRTADDFRPNVWRDFSNFISGTPVQRWVATRTLGESLDGYVEIQTRPKQGSRLTLRVRPQAAGQLEGDLLHTALRHRVDHSYLWLPVLTDHPAGDKDGEQRLLEAGFRPLRTLRLMQLELKYYQ